MAVDERNRFAQHILRALTSASPGSAAILRGSLAAYTADEYSDIDALWDVPDADFLAALTRVGEALSTVAPVESLRSDPAFQRSDRRRLFYVRFAGVPLFWRLDLDVFAHSVGRDDAYDRGNPRARGTIWSPTESALMNVIAAVKAHYRRDDQKAFELLHRAYERVGVERRREILPEQLRELNGAIGAMDPTMRPLVAEINRLIGEAFCRSPGGGPRSVCMR